MFYKIGPIMFRLSCVQSTLCADFSGLIRVSRLCNFEHDTRFKYPLVSQAIKIVGGFCKVD